VPCRFHLWATAEPSANDRQFSFSLSISYGSDFMSHRQLVGPCPFDIPTLQQLRPDRVTAPASSVPRKCQAGCGDRRERPRPSPASPRSESTRLRWCPIYRPGTPSSHPPSPRRHRTFPDRTERVRLQVEFRIRLFLQVFLAVVAVVFDPLDFRRKGPGTQYALPLGEVLAQLLVFFEDHRPNPAWRSAAQQTIDPTGKERKPNELQELIPGAWFAG